MFPQGSCALASHALRPPDSLLSGALPPQTLPRRTAPSLRAQQQCLTPTAIPCSTMGMPQPSLTAAPPSTGTAATRVHVQGSARDSLDSVADAAPERAQAPDATDNGGAPLSCKVRVSQLHGPGCVEAMAAVPHHACNGGSSDLPRWAALLFEFIKQSAADKTRTSSDGSSDISSSMSVVDCAQGYLQPCQSDEDQ